MIPLSLPAHAESEAPFIARLRAAAADPSDAVLVANDDLGLAYAGSEGLFTIDGADANALEGDIVLVQGDRVERLIRAQSKHNTMLVTERCDQLCVMCSQPPKKTHVDRFAYLEAACLLAPEHMLIGITGGEPTLYKDQLFDLIEHVHAARPDLTFHVLSNGQHFEEADLARLRGSVFKQVAWGIPLYAADAALHDRIVGKAGAFDKLQQSFAILLRAGARIELRTVLLTSNAGQLANLALMIGARLRFIEAWSIMQLENIGYARRRWHDLLYDHAADFGPVADGLDLALLHGVPAQLFNFPLCTVPTDYRHLAVASVSDWKRKLAPACNVCQAATSCSGFFEWHPDADAARWANPI